MFEILKGKRFPADLLFSFLDQYSAFDRQRPLFREKKSEFFFPARETRKLVHVVTPPRPPPIGNLTLEIGKEKRVQNEKRQKENAHRPLDADAIQDDVNKSE